MSVLYFLLMVGALVTVHELGHFVAAKLLGVKVLRFSLGFGPAVARLRGPETEYRISAFPLGGYVRLLGEDPADEIADGDAGRALPAKALWRRAVIVLAGPLANLLCPIAIYFAFFAGHTELPAAVIGDVFPSSPAATAGLQPNDRIVEVDGRPIRYWEEFETVIDASPGRMLRLKVRRGSQELQTYVAPRKHALRHRTGFITEQGLIGITQAPFEARVGVLDSSSPAARAGLRTGDLVVSVDGEAVASYTELERALQRHQKRAAIAYLRGRHHRFGFADIEVRESGIADLVPSLVPDPGGRIRASAGIDSAEFFVSEVAPGSPAERAGLRAGDLITSLNGAKLPHWVQFDQALQAEPDRTHRLAWLRALESGGTEEHEASLRQERVRVIDEYGSRMEVLVFGASNDFRVGPGEMVPIRGRLTYALSHAVDRTGETIVEMTDGIMAIVRGKQPRDTVGGPLTIYRMASVSGAKGWDSFLLMLALISVNLGLLNLLPIPIFDGGNLVLFAIEAATGRRLSPRLRERASLVGLILIVALTVLALKNDIVRLLQAP